MKKSKLPFIILIVLIFFIDIYPTFAEDLNLNPFDYARITDVDYKAVVVDEPNCHGKVIVTERLTFDIHAASESNPFWELWRDLPEEYIDGVKTEYTVRSVKQILDDGTEVVYPESQKLYWLDSDYVNTVGGYGPGKWYHSEGPYNEDLRDYECVFFYVDGLYREKVTFEIEYEMTNASLRYNDCSELYLCMYSEETIKHLESFKGQILFPNENMPASGNYDVHTYGTNSHTFPFTESTTINPGYHTFSFELDESQLKFRPYNQYIEFSLVSHSEDKHIFTEYASRNNYYYDDVLSEIEQEQKEYDDIKQKYMDIKVIILLAFSAIAYLIIDYAFHIDKKIKKKHIFYEPTMQMDYFRDIPSNLDPNFAASLVFCKDKIKKDNEDIYAAITLSLVRKGYIELERIDVEQDWVVNNVKIIIKYRPQKPTELQPELSQTETVLNDFSTNETFELEQEKLEPLTLTEEHYFNLIVRHSLGAELPMKTFQDKVYSDIVNTNSFVRNMENSIVNIGISQGYFQKADYEQPKKQILGKAKLFKTWGFILIILVNLISYQTYLDLAFGAFFILGFTLLISSSRLRKLANKYILLTQFGEDEYVKWRGLYDFLNSETLMNERTVVELPMWEQYLVYATAFGISEKVIAALKIRCPDVDMSPMLSNSYYTSRNFYSSNRSFRSTTNHVSYVSRSTGYGGYGGHGGYGGGGRGGGGGRRRSLIFSK